MATNTRLVSNGYVDASSKCTLRLQPAYILPLGVEGLRLLWPIIFPVRPILVTQGMHASGVNPIVGSIPGIGRAAQTLEIKICVVLRLLIAGLCVMVEALQGY